MGVGLRDQFRNGREGRGRKSKVTNDRFQLDERGGTPPPLPLTLASKFSGKRVFESPAVHPSKAD